uniref:GDT1 family protein n=1 Tax=Rhodosorus marinus TaxID=101924 RepID=A0A7S0BFI4_9RHOD
MVEPGFVSALGGLKSVHRRTREAQCTRRAAPIRMALAKRDKSNAAQEVVQPQRPKVRETLRNLVVVLSRIAKRSASFRTKHGASVKLAKLGLTMPILLAMASSPAAVTVAAGPWRSFTSAFGVVLLSQFGDKSMFATALMAMRYNPLLVFVGAVAALTMMTAIACFLGQVGQFLDPKVTWAMSIILFAFFGIQMLLQSRELPDKPGIGGEVQDAKDLVVGVTADGSGPIMAKTSSLIFVAEWLDRSMIATMALAASGNTAVVFVGASAANVVCSIVAVLGAAFVSTRISERTVAIIAGVLFEIFAVYTFFEPSLESD